VCGWGRPRYHKRLAETVFGPSLTQTSIGVVRTLYDTAHSDGGRAGRVCSNWLPSSSGLSCGKPILGKHLIGLDLVAARYYVPEFVARAIVHSLHSTDIETAFIDPGKPWQNAADESFNGKFGTSTSACSGTATARKPRSPSRSGGRCFNDARLHSSLNYRTPKEFKPIITATASPSARNGMPLVPGNRLHCSRLRPGWKPTAFRASSQFAVRLTIRVACHCHRRVDLDPRLGGPRVTLGRVRSSTLVM